MAKGTGVIGFESLLQYTLRLRLLNLRIDRCLKIQGLRIKNKVIAINIEN